MNEKQLVRNSKFLSLVLRHKPEEIGVSLDDAGWVSVDILLKAMNAHKNPLTLTDLKYIVNTSDKKRFALNDDETMIRANQGHSVEVELKLEPKEPPAILYHGTPERFVSSIRNEGLKKMERHAVHLSADYSTAVKVGERRGKCIVLTIDSTTMHKDGFIFMCSENGVWLTENVPPKYIM